MKQVQIDSKLFFDLYEYFCNDNDTVDLESVKTALRAKYERLQSHAMYSLSKNKKLTPEQREYFRQQYLDGVGVPEEFRY